MEASKVDVLGIVGAGQMGVGIAQVAATSGMRVVLADIDLDRAARGKAMVAAALSKGVDKGKITVGDRETALERVVAVDGVEAMRDVDFAIEAVAEDFDIKAKVLRRLEGAVRADVVLATNTSSLSITSLAAAVAHSQRIIGLHFMNPVPVLGLVEIVSGFQTSDGAFRTARVLASRLGKHVVVSKDRPGFVVNRMLTPFLNEACFALEEGLASTEDIDAASKLGLGHPMGPLELADLIGLDTLLAITEVLHRGLGDDKYRPAVLLRNLVAAGWFGRKAGRGFYVYDANGKKMGPTAL